MDIKDPTTNKLFLSLPTFVHVPILTLYFCLFSYLERVAFLNRTEQRQFEKERDLRLTNSSKRWSFDWLLISSSFDWLLLTSSSFDWLLLTSLSFDWLLFNIIIISSEGGLLSFSAIEEIKLYWRNSKVEIDWTYF